MQHVTKISPKTIENNISSNRKTALFIKNGSKIERINLDDILYIEGSGNYIAYQLKNRKILALDTMSVASDNLPKDQFIRIHKSFIIPIDKIDSIENNHVFIGDKKIPISNTYKSTFFEFIKSQS